MTYPKAKSGRPLSAALFVLTSLFVFSPVNALTTPVVFTGSPGFPQCFPGVDTLWLGATMYTQADNDSVVVQFVYQSTWWANVLYFMDPIKGDTVRVFGFDQEKMYQKCPVNPTMGQGPWCGVLSKKCDLQATAPQTWSRLPSARISTPRRAPVSSLPRFLPCQMAASFTHQTP